MVPRSDPPTWIISNNIFWNRRPDVAFNKGSKRGNTIPNNLLFDARNSRVLNGNPLGSENVVRDNCTDAAITISNGSETRNVVDSDLKGTANPKSGNLSILNASQACMDKYTGTMHP
jgi:hypothetical protein